MKFQVHDLISSLMRDLGICQSDCQYVLKRLAAEGFHFLTVELPKISKAVISGLETGLLDRTELTSFSFSGSTLKFLSGLVNQVFDKKTGLLLETPSCAAIGTIRQLCEYVYKLALPFTRAKENEAKANFVKNEEELLEIGRNPEVLAFACKLRKDFENHWSHICNREIHEIFKEFRPRPTNGTFVGSDEVFYLYRNSTDHAGSYPFDTEPHKGFFKPYSGDRFTKLKKLCEPSYSELLLVPKDSRGPRTICREHILRVETQMAYFDFMCSELNRYSGRAINFTDQLVNRKIAEESSVSKRYSTLDLKDASDRVSIMVVKEVFRNSRLYFFVTGSRRATHVSVDGNLRQLSKLAGMGSGLTFPTMSLLISLAICNVVSKKCPNLLYDDIRKRIFIYGDDICVPTEWVEYAYHGLAIIGLKVNKNKSFTKGNFRESCGGDYAYGVDVTPCRLKLTNSKLSIDADGALHTVDSANSFKELYEHSKELWKHNLKSTCSFVMSLLRSFYFAKFGIQMAPGRYEEECDWPVDYTKGTTHLPVDGHSTVYTIVPEQIRRLDERNFITKKGRVYSRSKYKYLGQNLRVVTRDSATFDHNTDRLVNTTNFLHRDNERVCLERVSPSVAPSVAELTIPRKLTFQKKVVANDFLLKDAPSREHFEDQLRRDRFYRDLSALIYCQNFYNSYL